ncbi:NAD(P)-binding protein [Infundibulicybe gibba]|nr:NAD(P)-binding protein [Infundibulicybe gibba]
MALARAAIVTGAARGMGRAIALRLASDGFDVAVNDLPSGREGLETLAAEITHKGRKAMVMTGDVSKEKDVKALVENTVNTLGDLNCMVANAGRLLVKSMVETTLDEWEQVFSVNSRGVFLCYKHAARRMIQQGEGGRIIGAASVAGKQGYPYSGGYSATKFAVRGMTQCLAQELGPHGITVNSYAPGAINTMLLKASGAAVGREDTVVDDEAKNCVLGYVGNPEDVASIVSYLASREAHYITGQSVSTVYYPRTSGDQWFLTDNGRWWAGI